MIPVYLHLENAHSHADTRVDFALLGEAACLVGPTGAGKSSVIDGLLYALTGKTRDALDEMIRRGENHMTVEFRFRVGGGLYRIIRKRTRAKGKRPGESIVSLSAWDESGWGDPLVPAQERIEQLAGGDYEVLTATSFCMQGDSAHLIGKRPAERLKTMRALLRAERFGDYKKTATAEIGVAEVRQEQAARDLADAEQALAEADEAARAIAPTEAEIAEQRAEEVKIADAIADLTAELAEIVRAEVRRTDLALAVERAAEDHAAAERARDAARSRLDAARVVASGVRYARTQAEAHARAVEARDAAEELLRRAREALDVAESAERAHAKRAAELVAAEHDAARRVEAERAEVMLERKIAGERARAALDQATRERQARSEALTRARGELVTARGRAGRLRAVPCGGAGDYAACGLIADATAARDALPTLEARAQAAEVESADQSAVESAQAAYQAARAAFVAEVPPTTSANVLEAARAAREAHGATRSADAERAAHREAESTVATWRAEVDRLAAWPGRLIESERAAAELPALEAEAQEAAEGARRAVARVVAARADLAAVATGRADELRERRGTLQHQLDGLRGVVAELAVRLTGLRAKVAESGAARLRLEAAQAQALAVRAEVARLQLLAEIYQEIPVHLMSAALPAIEQAGNAMLGQLGFTERMRLADADEAKNGSVKDSLDVWVTDQQGHEAPYLQCSGGERFSIDLAFRDGMGQLLAARSGATDRPMLIIDEGWGSLDPDHIKAFSQVLATIIESRRYSLVLAVSHVQELVDVFPRRVQLAKDARGVSRLALAA